jgi:ferredoxin
MIAITIDADVCKKDGLCAMTCMRAIFQQEEKDTIPKIVDQEHCYTCGQCVAICPHDAISHSDYPKDTVKPVKPEYVPSYDHVMELIRSRRSKRSFKKKQVEKEVMEKVLEAARFAPSGHNEQTTEFVVVQNKETIQKIASLTAGHLVKNVKNGTGQILNFRLDFTTLSKKHFIILGFINSIEFHFHL